MSAIDSPGLMLASAPTETDICSSVIDDGNEESALSATDKPVSPLLDNRSIV